MDEIQTNKLRENRVNIVNDLEPKGKVLDKLYEDGILTENDIELVSSAATRKERCHLLLSILPTRGPVAYGSFQKALEAGQYDFLADKLGTEATEIHENTEVKPQMFEKAYEETHNKKPCEKCLPFIEGINSKKTRLNDLILRILRSHCCLLLDNIEPKDIIDQLFQDHVITEDDIDVIVTRTTRRNRCEKLFQILLYTNEERVAESLRVSLMKKYSFIVENIANDFDKNKPKDHDVCAKTKSDIVHVREVVSECPGILDNSGPCTNGSDTDMTTVKIPAFENNQETTVKELLTDGNQIVEKQTQVAADIADGTVVVAPSKLASTESKKEHRRKDNRKERCSDYTFKPNAGHGATEVLVKYKTQTTFPSKRKQKRKVQVEQTLGIENAHEERNDKTVECKEIVPMQMTAIQSQKPSRRLSIAFNYLSTLINQGDFTKFEDISLKLQTLFPTNFDLMCILGYLQTSRDLFKTDFDSAKSQIDKTMALLPRTSNPRYFMLELFTAKTRMYITRKKLEKLQITLDEAMMILETDPVGCTGRAAGWLYINDARNKTAQLSCLNLRSPNACHVYERLYESAKSSFQRSMTNFKRDGGKDGPFGFGYALCRLVILLLRCGDNGLTMETMTPSADDIHSAGQYLNHLEDSDIVISKILDMHFRLAKCDYQFRRGNIVRALEHAQIAHDLATELRLLEFTEHAYNRVSFLKSKSSVVHVSDEISEEEVHRILFEEASSSECDTPNEQV